MLSVFVGQAPDISMIFFFIFLVIGILIALFSRRETERFLKANTTVFTTTYDIDATYDAIVKRVEAWQRQPFKPIKRSLASIRWWIPRFTVHKDTRPRLYRVADRFAGVITFELTSSGDGGTSVKITHSPDAWDLIDAFRTELPIKVPSSLGKTCSSCKRIYPPSYTHCPYCSIALP